MTGKRLGEGDGLWSPCGMEGVKGYGLVRAFVPVRV